MTKEKGVAIDVDSEGKTIVIVPRTQIDTKFIDFARSEEYADWLEDAHAGEVDFPYNEPLMIGGKEYNLKVLRIPANGFSKIGDEIEYDSSDAKEPS